MFVWILERLWEAGEASAVPSTLKRKDTIQDSRALLKRLADEAGEPMGTVKEWIAFDGKRLGKKLSNKEWKHPADWVTRLMKMRHGHHGFGPEGRASSRLGEQGAAGSDGAIGPDGRQADSLLAKAPLRPTATGSSWHGWRFQFGRDQRW